MLRSNQPNRQPDFRLLRPSLPKSLQTLRAQTKTPHQISPLRRRPFSQTPRDHSNVHRSIEWRKVIISVEGMDCPSYTIRVDVQHGDHSPRQGSLARHGPDRVHLQIQIGPMGGRFVEDPLCFCLDQLPNGVVIKSRKLMKSKSGGFSMIQTLSNLGCCHCIQARALGR